jgi:hypothetical protein
MHLAVLGRRIRSILDPDLHVEPTFEKTGPDLELPYPMDLPYKQFQCREPESIVLYL